MFELKETVFAPSLKKTINARRTPTVTLSLKIVDEDVKISLEGPVSYAGTWSMMQKVHKVEVKTKTHYDKTTNVSVVFVLLCINEMKHHSVMCINDRCQTQVDGCDASNQFVAYILNEMLYVKDVASMNNVLERKVVLPDRSAAPTPMMGGHSLLYPHTSMTIVNDEVVEYSLIKTGVISVRFAGTRPVIAYKEVLDRIRNGETHFSHTWDGTGYELIYTREKRACAECKRQKAILSDEAACNHMCMGKPWAFNFGAHSSNKALDAGFVTLTHNGTLVGGSMFEFHNEATHKPIVNKPAIREAVLVLLCARQNISPQRTGQAFMEMILTQADVMFKGKPYLFTISQAGEDVIRYYENAVGAEVNPNHTMAIQYPTDTFMTSRVPVSRKRKIVYSAQALRLLLF